jgi:hypothetical protein
MDSITTYSTEAKNPCYYPNRDTMSILRNSPTRLMHCPRCDGLYFININTGEKVNGKCKSYKCEFCGPYKALTLRKAMEQYFSKFDRCRLVTLTFRTTIFYERLGIEKTCQEIWRRFLIAVRRNTALTELQRNFNYVRVLEFTKRGYPHFHLVIDQWLPRDILQAIWNITINSYLQKSGKSGHCDIRSLPNQAKAAEYVSKYVLKGALEKNGNYRLWSKSNKVSIFEHRVSSGEWQFINLRHSGLTLLTISITSLDLIENAGLTLPYHPEKGTFIRNKEYIQQANSDPPIDENYVDWEKMEYIDSERLSSETVIY